MMDSKHLCHTCDSLNNPNNHRSEMDTDSRRKQNPRRKYHKASETDQQKKNTYMNIEPEKENQRERPEFEYPF